MPAKILILFSLLLFVTATSSFGETEINQHQIDWQYLSRQQDIVRPDITPMGFTKPAITLQKNETVYVFLPANRWFYLERLDEEASDEGLTALHVQLSATPGLAQNLQWQQQQHILPPQSQNRVIALVNQNSEHDTEHGDIRVRLAQGRGIRHNRFSPLSWLLPDVDDNSSRDQRLPEQRDFNSSHNQHQHEFYPQPEQQYQLQENAIYWQEGTLEQSDKWQTGQSQLVTRESRSAISESTMTFAQTSRKRLLSSEQELFSHHLKRSEAILFHQPTDAKTTLQLQSNTSVRMQKVDEDWLFGDNYQDYSATSIRQRLSASQFSQPLYQQLMGSLSSSGKDAPLFENRAFTQPLPLTREQQRLTNRWTRWRPLIATRPEGKPEQTQKQLIQERQTQEKWPVTFPRWDFQPSPDLSHDPVATNNPNAVQSFYRLNAGQSVLYSRPDDSLTNQLQLQALLPKSGTPDARLLVEVDGKAYQEFSAFSPEQLRAFIFNPDWQLSTTAKHNQTEKKISSHTLNLPSDWQKIRLKIRSGTALVKIRQRQPRIPKLDGPQWQQWLAQTQHWQAIPIQYQQHPHWIQFKQYISEKNRQFEAEKLTAAWQQLLSNNKPLTGLFDLSMPDGMENYQILQTLMLSPRPTDWQYWKLLATTLQNGGWSAYANRVIQTLIKHHPDVKLVEAASEYHFETLAQKQQYSQQVSLLSYLFLKGRLSPEFRTQITLSLAHLLQQQSRCDMALFALGFAPPSGSRSALIQKCAQQQGFKALAKHHHSLSATIEDKQVELLNNAFSDAHVSHIAATNSREQFELYNAQLNVSQSNYLVTPEQPLELELKGAQRIKLVTRQWFEKQIKEELSTEKRAETKHLSSNDWLNIKFAQKEYHLPIFYSDYRSDGLVHPKGTVGAAHRQIIDVPASGKLTIKPNSQPVLVNLTEVTKNALNSTVTQTCSRQNTRQRLAYIESEQTDLFNCVYPEELEGTPIGEGQLEGTAIGNVSIDRFSISVADTSVPANYLEFLSQLQAFEAAPIPATLAQLNAELHHWPDSASKYRLQRRLNQKAQWQPQNSPIRVKKFSTFRANTGAPLTPQGYRAKLMYVPYQPELEQLSEKSTLNYNLAVEQDEEYRLTLHSQTHLFQTDSDARVEININGNLFAQQALQMGDSISVPLPLPPGNQRLALRLSGSVGQVSVQAKLEFRKPNESWRNHPQQIRIKLFHADKEQPLQQFFPHPTWLRIDSFDSVGMQSQTFVLAERGMFSWYPTKQNAIGHRLYALNLLPKGVSLTQQREAVPESQTPAIEQVSKKQTFPSFQFLQPQTSMPEPDLFGRTWGVALSQQQRRTPDDDNPQNNRFWQLQGYSQNSSEGRYLSRYQLAVRDYQSDFEHSLHGQYQWWDTQWWHNLDLNVGLSVAGQKGYLDDEQAWSARAHAQTQWQYSLNNRFYNRFNIGIWGNFIESGKNLQQYATSVYSQFKLDHRYGLRLSENIRYKWTHDLESWASVTLNSNRLSQQELLDNSILQLGSRIYYQGLSADIRWRYQRFFADQHRASSANDSRLSLRLNWFYWHNKEHYRIHVNYDRNLTFDENYWNIGFSYNFSRNRGVRDYLPQSLSFAPLRQQEFNRLRLQHGSESTDEER